MAHNLTLKGAVCNPDGSHYFIILVANSADYDKLID